MNIGEKIKTLRSAKMMTQSELAGDMITRNMLSQIENGVAQPSLQTIIYLAGRLNVPAGFLLAEEGDDFMYRKMNCINNVKHAYANRDFRSCRDICESVFGTEQADDEISMILCACWKEIGAEESADGHLHRACRCFDKALEYSERTVYDTRVSVSEINAYFSYFREISPALISDIIDEPQNINTDPGILSDDFCRYVSALRMHDSGDAPGVDSYLENSDENNQYAMHIKAKRLMARNDHAGALEYLKAILQSDQIPPKILLYNVVCDMEICCRETEDYKGAYECAKDKIGLHERLLEDSD